MAAYNLVIATLDCPKCGESGETRVQFKFGDTWQHHYVLGDTLHWGGNDTGVKGQEEVVADGASEGCPHCGFEGDFEVWIKNDVLDEVRATSGQFDFVKAQESYVVIR